MTNLPLKQLKIVTNSAFNSEPLYCTIDIYSTTTETLCHSLISQGEIDIDLKPDKYKIICKAGPLYKCQQQTVDLTQAKSCEISKFALEHYVDLRALGWYTCDVHNHISHPESPATIASFMKANSMDAVMVCQPWASEETSNRAYDGKQINTYLNQASSETENIYFGAELPKTRFGHTGWWKMPILENPMGVRLHYHDVDYFENAKDIKTSEKHPSKLIPYHGEWHVNTILRWKKQGGINAALHPTSWWTVKENQKVITSNIAVDYIYSLFAGQYYDSLVVMGYDAEQIFYQNLWFNLLNRGHKISGVAETDGNLDSTHKIGDLRQYTYTANNSYNHERLAQGIKSGRSFMTSGPILFVTGNNSVFPGDSMPLNKKHTLNVTAHANPEKPDDYISWIVLYRNGHVAEIIDIENQRLQTVQRTFTLPPEKERCWYIVKVYGSSRPLKREYVDIMAYCQQCEHEKHTEYCEVEDVTFTNPFYIEPDDYTGPQELVPTIKGQIKDSKTGNKITADITVLLAGESISSTTTDPQGNFELNMPLTAELEIKAKNHPSKTINLMLHHPAIANLLDEILAGQWALFPDSCLQPGQVPFEAFQYDKLKEILSEELLWPITL